MPFAEEDVGPFPVEVERHGFAAPHRFLHGAQSGVRGDQVHVSTLGAEKFQILQGVFAVGVLIGVDAVLLALEERLADAVRGVPIPHQLIEQTVEVGVSIKLVAAHHHAADFHVAEADFGKRSRGRRLRSGQGPTANVAAKPAEDFRKFRLLLMDFSPR